MRDIFLVTAIAFLVALSVFILKSIAPFLFPFYFVYIAVGVIAFLIFSKIGFEVTSIFSKHLYISSIFLLILTLIIGRVTRGAVRWIPIGAFTLQPAEIVRPFLLLYFARFLTKKAVHFKRFLYALILLVIPAFLILVQPSLGVTVLTVVGFLGVLLATDFDKKYILSGTAGILLLLPVVWLIMAPYQRQRVVTFLNPASDPLGAGYNSLQSTIAVGSGKLTGVGLGRGIQTQLSFLPEKQTDFVFAAVGEELGFIGVILMLSAIFIIFWRLTFYMENAVSLAARAFVSGLFLTLLAQVFVHVGMNLGWLPITGLPFPLVSAGGSSFLATMIGLGIAVGAYKK